MMKAGSNLMGRVPRKKDGKCMKLMWVCESKMKMEEFLGWSLAQSVRRGLAAQTVNSLVNHALANTSTFLVLRMCSCRAQAWHSS